jgi:hydroxymethylpyrimidine/phosphomethylpyrimidine kinase
LRIEQAREIAEVTADAKAAAAAVDGTLNSQTVVSNADRRLALYDRFSPILDQLTAAQSASRVDPAASVRAVVTAHHKLAQAITSNKGETIALITNVEDLASAAQGVLAPAAK